MASTDEQVTRLLQAIDRGESGAAADLLPLVYEELRSRAGALMSKERREHSLQRTALVHEAYLKLVGSGASFSNQVHFFAAAALAMRRILVDHATRRNSLKRGGNRRRVPITDLEIADDSSAESIDWVDLDSALRELEQHAPRQHQVVMLRFFTGRTEMEIAEMLQVSEPTVRRDWATAKIWLYRAMKRQNDDS